MSHLLFFANISPHGSQLLSLVSGINVVEYCELGTQEVSEVSDFNITKVESNQILVMPDHSSNPFVVRPSSESGNRVDCCDVDEEEDKTSSASGERLVVRRNLLRTNSFEESLHVVEVREHKRVLVTVVWVNVALLHVLNVLLIVTLTILGLVDGLLPN